MTETSQRCRPIPEEAFISSIYTLFSFRTFLSFRPLTRDIRESAVKLLTVPLKCKMSG